MKIFFAILGAATLALTGTAHAELLLELNSKSDHHLLAEPITINVTLTNTGAEPVQVMKDLAPEFGAVKYTIKQPGGQEITFTPWAIKEPGELFVELSPRQSISDTAALFFNGTSWTFTETGDYEIQATYAGSLKSEPLKINVSAPPEPAAQQAARSLLASPEAGLVLLLGGGDHLTGGLRVLEEVSAKAPGTPYAAYADLALGVRLVRPFADFAQNKLRPADPATAATHLEKVDVQQLNLKAAATARLALAHAYRAMNAPEKANAIENELPGQLEKQFPKAPDIRSQLIPKVKHSLKK